MDLTFRLLEPADYPIFAGWLAAPHVARWWGEPGTVHHVAEAYGADPHSHTYVVLDDGRPIGIVRAYPADRFPEHYAPLELPGSIGVDLLIGDPALVGRGYGTRLLQEFVRQVVPLRHPGATGVVSDPEVANVASVRAFEKAGFVRGAIVAGEDGPEQLVALRF